jgi:hypothetical protein
MKGYVYKISHPALDMCYIGCTKKLPYQRFSEHRSAFLSPKTRFHSSCETLFRMAAEEADAFRLFRIEVLEELDFSEGGSIDRIALRRAENKHMEAHQAYLVNKRRAIKKIFLKE